jgi:hypothetical protein
MRKFYFIYFLVVLEIELRVYTLSHSTSPYFYFSRHSLMNHLPGLGWNRDLPDLCLLSS